MRMCAKQRPLFQIGEMVQYLFGTPLSMNTSYMNSNCQLWHLWQSNFVNLKSNFCCRCLHSLFIRKFSFRLLVSIAIAMANLWRFLSALALSDFDVLPDDVGFIYMFNFRETSSCAFFFVYCVLESGREKRQPWLDFISLPIVPET